MAQDPSERLAHQRVLAVAIGRERGLAVTPQRQVQMHRVAGLITERLRHERGDRIPPPRQLTRGVLEPSRLIGGLQRLDIAEVDLTLARSVFGVSALELDERTETVEDLAEHGIELV